MKDNQRYCYPKLPAISSVTGMAEMPLQWEFLIEYARMKSEQGAEQNLIQELVDEAVETLRALSHKLQQLPDDERLKNCEPDDLFGIRSRRPAVRTQIEYFMDKNMYYEKLYGAVMGRFAGCTLGAPVEFWSVEDMKEWADYCGQDFPPTEYWRKTKRPNELRYEVSRFEEYERDRLNKVPVDDDVTYTILNLLVLREYGVDFTTKQVGEVWKKYLPRACTSEEIVLNHLQNGVPAEQAAELDNPYVQWIGADIRADVWGYISPGLPAQAAEMAYRDACLTHRRNGIYGEMYFAAVIAAAMAVGENKQGSPMSMEEVLRIGLEEIPEECLLARDIRWALSVADSISDYRAARTAAEKYFGVMSGVHTNWNACLTIWGLLIGREDFTRVIGQITAMGYDNDCNAATAGSIFGAFYGLWAIPEKWYQCFNNQVFTYLKGKECMKIDMVCEELFYYARQIHDRYKTEKKYMPVYKQI